MASTEFPKTDWRGMALAALLALLTALPQLMLLPALDRDEARFAQASRQMLQSGDLIDIRFQDDPRYKKPVGIYWAQAAVVSALPDAARDDIRAYRIPSLIGAMLAAAVMVWGLGGLVPAVHARLAGVFLAISLTLGIEGAIAKTDALLTGVSMLALWACVRLYRGDTRMVTRGMLWAGLGLGVLIKGPVTPALVLILLAGLWITDRDQGWMRTLWFWPGVVGAVALLAPWAILITLKTGGAFWHDAIAGDLAPKLAGGHERHGGPFGLHSLITPFGLWPASVVLPAALWWGWRQRHDALTRALLVWGVGGLLLFELTPTKLAHYALPTYGTWIALGVMGWAAAPRWAQRTGAVIALLVAAVVAAVMVAGALHYNGMMPVAVAAAVITVGLALVAAVWIWRGRIVLPALVATALAAHGGLALTAHGLRDLWLAPRMADALYAAGWDGRAPVASLGYAEPSLVFAVGTDVAIRDVAHAAAHLAAGGWAWADTKSTATLRAALPTDLRLQAAGQISGYNYSRGDPVRLTLYRITKDRP